MALIYSRGGGLGDNAPNFVELYNNPDQGSPWVTNYATGATAPAPAAAPKKTATKTAITTKPAATRTTAVTPAAKVQLKRAGPAGALLDKLLPLVADQAGNRTIYGLPPVLVYLAGGVLSSTLLVYLYRLLTGKGGGRRRRTVSNPKRHRARPRRAKR